MKYALDALKKYADFSGRARRSEYWYYVLFLIIALIVAMVIDMLLWETPILYMLVALGTFIPSIAVVVRRLHDTGRSGWWYFIALVPLVGSIVLLVFLCEDSKPGVNKWGPNPKETPTDDIIDHLVTD